MSNLMEWMQTHEELQASSGAMGTKVAEYIETKIPRQCNTCNHFIGENLCNEKHMLQDPQVATHADSGLKIVEPIIGCCRFWFPKKGK